MRKAYLSYPMTHGETNGDRGLQAFKKQLEENLIIFDPADVNDFDVDETTGSLIDHPGRTDGSAALATGTANGFSDREAQHISDQIVFRDYKLIAQSDMIVVYYDIAVPSPGVVSEMNYALLPESASTACGYRRRIQVRSSVATAPGSSEPLMSCSTTSHVTELLPARDWARRRCRIP